MGQPVKIIDIANELIRLSGLEPDIDIPISFVGARPGERQYEKLSHDSEIVQKTLHDKILQIRSTLGPNKIKDITEKIMEGELNGNEFNNDKLKETLSNLIPEYKPLDKDTGNPIILNVKPEIEA